MNRHNALMYQNVSDVELKTTNAHTHTHTHTRAIYCATCDSPDHYTGQMKCPRYPRDVPPPSVHKHTPLVTQHRPPSMGGSPGDVSSFSKLSVTSSTSRVILQPFPRFAYVTVHSPTVPLLHLRQSSFSNPSFASPASQDFHLRHLASRPCPPRQKKTQRIHR